MLIGYYVVFVFRVGRLVLGWDVDQFIGEVGWAVEFL